MDFLIHTMPWEEELKNSLITHTCITEMLMDGEKTADTRSTREAFL
jgi:hypothetical protein